MVEDSIEALEAEGAGAGREFLEVGAVTGKGGDAGVGEVAAQAEFEAGEVGAADRCTVVWWWWWLELVGVGRWWLDPGMEEDWPINGDELTRIWSRKSWKKRRMAGLVPR